MDILQANHASANCDKEEIDSPNKGKKIPFATSSHEYSICIAQQSEFFSWIIVNHSSTQTPYIIAWGLDRDKNSFEETITRLGLTDIVAKSYISTYLQSNKTLFRKINLPITISPKDRYLALIDAIEKATMPSSGIGSYEENTLAYRIDEETDDEVIYSTFTASKISVKQAKELTDEVWYPSVSQVEKVFPKGACLEAWAHRRIDLSQPTIIIDVGVSETSVIFFLNQQIEIHRCIPIGLSAFSQLEITIQQYDQQGIDSSTSINPSLRTLLQSLLEIKESALIRVAKQLEISPAIQSTRNEISLAITGPILCSPIYPKITSQFLELPEASRKDIQFHPVLEKEENVCDSNRIPLDSLAVELGAALLGNERTFFSSQKERVPEFELQGIPPSYIFLRHAKSSLVMLFIASLALSFFLIFWNSFEEKYIYSQYRKEIQSLSEHLVTQPLFPKESTFIQEIQQKNILEDTKDLSLIETSLEQLKDEIKKKSFFSLQPTTPSLSETLLFLNTLTKQVLIAQANAPKQSTSDPATPSICLTSCKYVMVKRPDIKRAKDKYLVRVDIEFTAPSQAIARNFYDALLQSKNFIDKESEVKWSVVQGKYRASFFLKSQAPLPLYSYSSTQGGSQ